MARGWKINSQKVVLTNSGTLLLQFHLSYCHSVVLMNLHQRIADIFRQGVILYVLQQFLETGQQRFRL
jgi:hypothetical protein